MMAAAEQLDALDTHIGGVTAGQVMQVWHRVEPLLKRVVKPDTGHTLDSVRYALLTGAMQLWVIEDFLGIVITSVEDRPSEKILFVPFMVGDNMKLWLDDWIEVQEAFGRANGCVALEFSGRKGWNKIGETKTDYKPLRTIFRRELTDGRQ